MAAPRYKGELGSCVRIVHGNGDAETWDGKSVDPDKELAVVVDGSGYAARLKVAPSFGCVLHEVGFAVTQSESKEQ